MKDCRQFYIDGKWVNPFQVHDFSVINPATEEPIATISLGSGADVDRAVAAAKRAFELYSETTPEDRVALLTRISEIYRSRMDEMAEAISQEMGAPVGLARAAQAPAGLAHLSEIVKVLGQFKFEELRGSTLMRKEPIGVCGLITPWNWPMNQVVCKVAPALAAGCTMVLKPSEMAPLSAYLFAQILHEAGVPAGVFNLVNGDGPTVGAAISSHPDVAMVSFTGSTRAGVAVATAAAPTVKRVTQELGGKSANIILDDADLANAVKEGVQACFRNSGQSCNAPTRMLVPRSKMAEAVKAAEQAADAGAQEWIEDDVAARRAMLDRVCHQRNGLCPRTQFRGSWHRVHTTPWLAKSRIRPEVPRCPSDPLIMNAQRPNKALGPWCTRGQREADGCRSESPGRP